MSVLSKIGSALIGGDVSKPIEAVGNVLDGLFTSKEEVLNHEEVMARLNQNGRLVQTEINKVEASHRSIFVAGWRPFIGWVCGWNLLYLTFLRDIIAWAMSIWAPAITPPPPIGVDMVFELVVALLGLGTLRTIEKAKGRAK